jgi:hypothetical protein
VLHSRRRASGATTSIQAAAAPAAGAGPAGAACGLRLVLLAHVVLAQLLLVLLPPQPHLLVPRLLICRLCGCLVRLNLLQLLQLLVCSTRLQEHAQLVQVQGTSLRQQQQQDSSGAQHI